MMKNVPIDKLLHFISGFGLAAIFIPFLGLKAILVAVVVGALKEAYDSTGRGNVEFMDFAVTAIGGAVAYAAYLGLVICFALF